MSNYLIIFIVFILNVELLRASEWRPIPRASEPGQALIDYYTQKFLATIEAPHLINGKTKHRYRNGHYRFIFRSDRKLYIFEGDNLTHADFSRGSEVWLAGEITFKNDKLVLLTPESIDYPLEDDEAVERFLLYLKSQNVDISQTSYKILAGEILYQPDSLFHLNNKDMPVLKAFRSCFRSPQK